MGRLNPAVGVRKLLFQDSVRMGFTGGMAESAVAGNSSIVRYSMVGLVATASHYAILWVLVEIAGANAGLSAAIGAIAGALVAYAGNRRFTFRSRAPHHRALLRFVLVAGLAAIVNGCIVWAGTELLQVHYFVAQLVATALVLWLGFLLNRSWSFA